METLYLVVPMVMFVAALCRATFGFGDALVAMPLLLLVLPPTSAAAIVAILGLALGLVMLARQWREVDWAATRRLLVAALFGVPVGLAMVAIAPERTIKLALGVAIMCYAAYSLAGWALPRAERARWAYLFGFMSGTFGAAYNFSGPPVVLYGSLKGWTPEQFRTSLQGFFAPIGVVIVASHAASGYWTPTTLKLTALAAPAMALGMLTGALLQRMFDAARFRDGLNMLLLALGGMLVFGG